VLGGSKSDFPILEKAVAILNELGIANELIVVSAHRTPDRLFAYAEEADARGIEVIIAGAGGAAHLPGMLAAKTHLPIIGIPIPTEHLRGLDSLLSIVQMPRGIPVATVAIGGAETPACSPPKFWPVAILRSPFASKAFGMPKRRMCCSLRRREVPWQIARHRCVNRVACERSIGRARIRARGAWRRPAGRHVRAGCDPS
jgi:phosphoribosylaminoimidazole carboxylase PurE protein